MNWKYIFNPFLKFDERKLLIVGILGFIVLTLSASSLEIKWTASFTLVTQKTTTSKTSS